MEEKKLVPKLRFPGFTEPWEQRKLGEVADIIGGGTPSTSFADYWDGDIDWYSPVEIGSNRYVSDSIRKITKLGLEKSSTKILPVGTVLFTSRAGIGNTAILRKEGCTNQGFQSIIPRKNILDTYFLYTLTPQLKRYGELMGAGSTFVEVSGRQMEKMPLNIPSLEEQKKVGKLFEILDDSITLHQRKLEHLKLKKKSLLQKLFPKEGEVYPELRFPGFTDPWEQRKLGEVANIKTGSRNQQDSVTNGQYPFFIRSEKIEKLDTYDFDTEAILVPGDGRIGEIFHYYNGKFALHQRVYKIDDFKGIDAFYLLYLFQYRFKEHALRLNAQGTVPSLRLPMFTEWDLCIPSLQEQGCIGRFLNKIELIITLHQRKLEHLQLLKKALLQQLFV